MRISLNQLCVFYLVAKHKSMSKAAKQLYVSAPAVTMQIKKLEHWLGFPLFERGQSEFKFTERGQGLFTFIEPIFNKLEELEPYIQDLMQAEELEIRLGTHHIPGNYFIPDLIAHVQIKYPHLKVHMELGTQDILLEKLQQQVLDLALIIGDLPLDKKCRMIPLFEEQLVLVTACDKWLGNIKSLSVKELDTIPLILQQKGSGARRTVLEFLQLHNVQPDIMLENLSSDVIKQFLPKMPAASFIGRFIVQKELDQGLLHEIKIIEKSPVCYFNLVYMDSQHIPIKISRFLSGVTGFSPYFHTHP